MESNNFEGKVIVRNNRRYYHGKFFENESKMSLRYEGKYGPSGKYGKGIQYENNRIVFDGHFRNDTRNGHGILYCLESTGNSNPSYDGYWKNGRRHGQGTSFIGGKKQYEGCWKDDKQNGKGSQYSSNGQLEFHGNFHNSIRQGKGIFYFEDQSNYLEGEFKSNCCHGKAVFYMNHLKRFEGNFRNGYPNGHGILYDEKEVPCYEGKWNNGHSCPGGRRYNGNGSRISNGDDIRYRVPIISTNNESIDAIRDEMNIRNYLETLNDQKIEHVSNKQLVDFLSKNYKIVDTTLDRENLLSVLKENYNKNKKLIHKDDEFDLFGNKIIIPCFGNDNQIYDLLSMEYLFLQNDENDYVNISYIYENNIRVPNYPIMEGGQRLTSYFCPTLES